MHKNIRTIVPSDEAVALRIVKPLHDSSHCSCPPGSTFQISRADVEPKPQRPRCKSIARSVVRTTGRVNRTFAPYYKKVDLSILKNPYKNVKLRAQDFNFIRISKNTRFRLWFLRPAAFSFAASPLVAYGYRRGK